DGALDLLQELKNIKMSLETLQSTRVGMSVNAVRKLSSDEEVQTLAKGLIKSWKKLIDGAEKKSEEKEMKPEPLVRSSSTCKDSGHEKRFEQTRTSSAVTAEEPQTPSASSRMTSFPPAPVTSDSVRNKCRELLVSALQTDGQQTENRTFCVSPSQIYQEFKSTDTKYKSRLRSRISNLKDQKNPDLRRNVLCGHIGPQRIASMSAEEMASAELKQMRETLTKESIREHQLSRVGGTETDMFVCSKCKGNNCTYNQ
ncbi:hypothetical protein NL108_011906, partial [Boleophthalmus pectinirostris]